MSSRSPRRPPRSLRSRSWRVAEYAALDFETTGLDHDRDAIVSFGVVPVRDGRVIVGESVHELVRTEIPSSPGSMRVHGILPSDLTNARPLPEAAGTLGRALDGRFLVTWFASVEIAFLRRLYGGRRSWINRTIDVRQMVIELEGFDQDVRQSLSSAADHYGVPVANPHEALDDAMVTAQLFLVVAARLEVRAAVSTRRLLKLTRA